jgi:O-antigen/teichoic acid export membrane protein
MAAERPESSGLVVRLAANSLVQIGGTGLASAISFFTFVAITRGLGPSAYGSYVAASAFLYLPSVLADLGLSTVVLREISGFPERMGATMRRSLPPRTLISAAAVGITVVIGLLLPFDEQTKTAIAILSLWAFAVLLNSTVLPVLQAQLRMQWAVLANVVGRLVTLGLTLLALAADRGFNAVVWAAVIGAVVTLVIDVAIVARSVSLRPVIDFDYWGGLVRTSLVLGLAVGLSQVLFRVDGVMLALFRSSSEVGLYGAAFKFIELSELIVLAIGISVFPVLTRLVAAGESERIGRAVQRTFDVLVATAIPLSIVLFAFPEELLGLTAGPEFERGSPALRILAFYPLLAFVAGLFWQVLIAAGRDRALLVSASAVLLLNVALNAVLLEPYGYQAAAATKLGCEVVALTAVSYLVHQTGVRLPRLGYAPVLAAAALTMAAVIVLLPGPAAFVGACALTAYALIVMLAPGTIHGIALHVLRSLRPAPTA